jgi:hypothetical protein
MNSYLHSVLIPYSEDRYLQNLFTTKIKKKNIENISFCSISLIEKKA